MDKINQAFQDLLEQRGFHLKAYEEDEQWLYKGVFEYSDIHYIRFAVSLTKHDHRAIGQIVFHKIAYQRSSEDTLEWLRYLNNLNDNQAIFYHFVLAEDETVYMRHLSEVGEDVTSFVNTLLKGPNLLRLVLPDMERLFGPFVVL